MFGGPARNDGVVIRPPIRTWQPHALRAAIRARGWTTARAAAEFGVTHRRVQRWTATRPSVPDPASFVRLAHVLGIPTTELAPLSDDPTLMERRWHAGLTVDALAHHLGRSPGYTGLLLQGAQPIPHASLPRWAAALHITPTQVQQAWLATRRQLLQP
jgi:transcriptional regulator with XRE-family HTH domain